MDEKPKDGTYTYSIAFAEWNGKSNGATCIVVIKGDSISVINSGNNLSGKKGEIMDKGVIMKHTKTGKWIIGHSPKDTDAKEVGGCSSGPSVIDFKRKMYWLC
ncbi:hypothetical protein [Pedobacter sp.]|uniref:hypothetical protein n=1 Tax=Pedobacter sp. TaxID=1411316 RepID=UPI002BBE55C7|nr:hypothetical protein [Pedobacter sp.]HWW41409.1 hypothetical protein [Pedobacter sp.]